MELVDKIKKLLNIYQSNDIKNEYDEESQKYSIEYAPENTYNKLHDVTSKQWIIKELYTYFADEIKVWFNSNNIMTISTKLNYVQYQFNSNNNMFCRIDNGMATKNQSWNSKELVLDEIKNICKS